MNVVVLVMDTVRADAINTALSNATLSSWVESGTGFHRAYVSAPWTLPSHASLFTGTAPSKHGAHAGHKHLDDTLTTLPEILHHHDYETVAVSNNTWISEEFGFGRGFETFYKTWQYVQSDTDLGRIARQEEGRTKLTEATKALFDGNPITNLTNAIYGQFFRKTEDDGAARTNEWIEDWLTTRNDSRPFFLFVNYLEPHLEYRPPKAHAQEYLPEDVSYEAAMEVPQDAWGYIADTVEVTDDDFEILRALYRAEIAYLVEKIQEVVDLCKAEDEWEESLFIVTSDHGENIGDHGLMDHQYALYDTLLHVPLFVHGGPFEDDESHDIVQLLDLPPTILDVLDIDAPEAREQFQGISFHPDADETREYAIAEYMAPQPRMDALKRRVGDLPEHVRTYDRSLRAIRTDDHKFIRGSDGSTELYDVQTDPEEMNDLFETHEDVVADLDTRLDEWLESFEHADPDVEATMSKDTKARLEDLGYLQD
ncbi:arylsulfatase protein [Halorhabdus tiamatea SARL4B]|uniref:Sulfatase n=1 Tax=Halorhabdus tiamatea SARL4B TaxID=1033806 RepID=F7PPR2_9EURY|nr:sulfatase [Halorhabdus tiamatea]ERJ04688.1 arylsulfatase protein [Halorhabdus tiamatea SARL4B]CCQ33127.1 sulfatase [Halorhabdus tiamatea SARL4B]